MAGIVAFDKLRPLTQAGLDVMRQLGLTVTVRLDLSHNQTIPILCDGAPTQAKPIHLDLSVEVLKPDALDALLSRLKERPTTSDCFQMYACLKHPTVYPHLRRTGVRIEVPAFGDDIAAIHRPYAPDDLREALACCRAPSRDAFNALPMDARRKMGMYLRLSNQSFRLESPTKDRTA